MSAVMPPAARRCIEAECCYFGQASASSCACANEVVIPSLIQIIALGASLQQVPRPARIWPPVATSSTPMTEKEAIEGDLINDENKAEKAIAAHQRSADRLQRRYWA